MSVRVRYSLKASVSSDPMENRDLGNGIFEVVSDLMSEGGSWKAVVPAQTTNLQIPFPGISAASFMVIRTTAKDPTLPPTTVTIRKNSSAGEGIDITPFGNKEGLFVLTTSGLTSIYATNTSASVDMELTFIAGGV